VAYRSDQEAPHFSHPILPEWTHLSKMLTAKLVRKRRARHLADLLLIKRAYRQWRHLQGMDLPPDVFNNEMLAVRHYASMRVVVLFVMMDS